MNGYQIKQRNRVIDPNNIPKRQLTDWEKDFQQFLRSVSDDFELSEGRNKKLNELAKLFA